ELLHALAGAGWRSIGTEPAPGIAAVGRAAGLQIEAANAAAYIAHWRTAGEPPFDGIVLLNVLEHVPDPATLLRDVTSALAPGGIIVERVPKDFSALQQAAHRWLGGRRWWIAIPDHVNYFDHA